ncbi:amidase, partial [bacterium]
MNPRNRLRTAGLAVLAVVATAVHARDLPLADATIADLQAAMGAGSLSSEKLVQLYLARIAAYD